MLPSEALSEGLDRLYGLPPESFTAARDELAHRLKRDGQIDEGETVRSLRRPTLPAWTINQLARVAPSGVAHLLSAGEELRAAQAHALADEDTGALRRAAAGHREAIRRLVGTARDLLAGAGRPATESTLDRVASSLGAASVDDHARELLRQGRLPRELEAQGFDAVAPLVAPAPSARRKTGTNRDRPRVSQAKLREAVRAARVLERESERRMKRARREAEAARAEAERAAAEEQAAAVEHAAAREEVERAEAELEGATPGGV